MSHRHQTRVLRACDSCTHSKQRCDGQRPWSVLILTASRASRRCLEREESCHYTKTLRKRGRPPRSDSIRSLRTEKHRAVDHESPQRTPQTPLEMIAESSASRPDTFNGMAPSDLRRSTIGEATDSMSEVLKNSIGTSSTDSSFSNQQEKFNPIFHRPPASIEVNSNQSEFPSVKISMDPTSPLKDFSRPKIDHDSNIAHGYSIKESHHFLNSILPHLQGVLSLAEALEMLEIYFDEGSNPLYKTTSPYMLAHVLHPSTVLSQADARPISPALLAVILFCVTQTADMKIFDTPGARERTSVVLYRLALDLLETEDPDNYFRTSDGWQFHPHPNGSSPSEFNSTPNRQSSGQALLPRQLGSTDIILAVTILTLTISGGHYKADSLKWKDKLVRLVRASGLSMEDQDIDLGPVFCGLYNGDATFRRWLISKEERRRLFWLIYSLDRHLALSFNVQLSLPEGTFCVRTPLPEDVWQSLDTADLTYIPTCPLGPPTHISGCGFFEYFLPLATVLGHIIDLHHYRSHPVMGRFVPMEAVHHIEAMISSQEQELTALQTQTNELFTDDLNAQGFSQQPTGPSSHSGEEFTSSSMSNSTITKLQLVRIYSTYLLHVFHILLHGKWDPISMIEDKDDWITSESFLKCASHALSATGVVSQILTLDPELLFMPYLFGIYLLQGSFILLLFLDRMPELGPNRSVEEVCETIIRAHEVSVVTLDTTFQKNFRKVFRSMLYDAQQAGPHSWDEHKARRRELLSLYRWTPLAHGLAY
ncbi:uncharacterized protein N7484_010960 [Penicillium longicatenatum]|uniref:uncharacterized protein n=1 Tax=Penicillium longicatenatum TaxID=1561947 RepID=UPI002547EF37|nr:uncharacterized protein N7484_010960 [Penicillium longicatenatum]KAJ5630860.1 hypothetical protein N7484_010960 [Penicillium longicatenatum]